MKVHGSALRFFVLVFALLLLGSVVQTARADEITVMGSTSASGLPTGIGFSGTSFGPVTTSAGFAGFSNLGSFTLSTAPSLYFGNTFSLLVAFGMPTGMANGGSSSFSSYVFGSVQSINTLGNGVDILFVPQQFTFANSAGSGSFWFVPNPLYVAPGQSGTLTGAVFGATATPVPEPTTLVLLGTSLLLLLPVLRRK